MKIIFATHNQGKLGEARALLGPNEIISAVEAGVLEEVEEDGQTMAENALKKARFVHAKTGHWVVADDSGLAIAALQGAPGVHTARWAGPGASGQDLIQHTLQKMQNVPLSERQAYFETAVAVISPTGAEWQFSGRVEGHLTTVPHGTMRPGLPYDVIFVPATENRTFAEMSEAEKNQLSHRGRAFRQLQEFFAQQ